MFRFPTPEVPFPVTVSELWFTTSDIYLFYYNQNQRVKYVICVNRSSASRKIYEKVIIKYVVYEDFGLNSTGLRISKK